VGDAIQAKDNRKSSETANFLAIAKGNKPQQVAPRHKDEHKPNIKKMNLKKIAISFGVFFAMYLVARIIENKVALVKKVANFGATA
jgi:hypothetical protein